MRTKAMVALFLAIAATPALAQEMQQMNDELPEVSDANIAAVVVAANSADIDNGELALEKSENEKVRGFAQQMIEAHTAVNQAATELVTDLGVTPEASDISRSIADGQAAEREKLAKLEGHAFDHAYINNEIAYHEAVIAALDGVLIPSATNATLKQTLVDTRPAFVAHLEQAKAVRESLKNMEGDGMMKKDGMKKDDDDGMSDGS